LGAHRPALRERRRGRWQSTTWGEWDQHARAYASWLIEQGVAPGDRVALLLGTRQAWFELDMAILMTGAVTVPLYPSMAPRQHAAQLADAGARWLLATDPLTVARLLREPGVEAQLDGCVVVDSRGVREQPDEQGRRALDVGELREATSLRVASCDEIEKTPVNTGALDQRADAIGPATLASIVYTSGTDGDPKGVMLTHDNFLFEVDALEQLFSLGSHDEQLLFLPMAHVFARILEMAQLKVGYVTTFSENTSRLLDEMAEVEPTFVGAVPRLFEQFHAQVTRALTPQTRVERAAWSRAIEVGISAARLRRQGVEAPLSLKIQHRAAEQLVFEKIRRAFGKRLRFAFCGGAPLAAGLTEWFHGVGVPLVEGYGLTETTSASHVNPPADPTPGTVGRPLPGVACRLAPDGEILLRGRGVCAGYWGRPALTAQLIDAEGWFHTGDLGTLEADRLKIVGRKKELLVTSGGHKVAPQPIEAMLQQSPLIQRAVLVGEGRARVAALLDLRDEAARAWERAREHPDPSLGEQLQAAIEAVNQRLASYEKIRHFVVLSSPLSQENGELTPTGKVRRERVNERRAAEINGMYEG